jgi:geranylgeranyl diphosphate synthase type II
VGGQADDLAAEQQDGGGLDCLEAIHRRKTGAMLRVALQLGGEIATASDLQLAALTRYGENLGLAFQVVDDLLDHGGNAEQLGKRTQKDANRGKLTYPRLLGVDASRQRAAKLIEDACAALSVFENQASQLTSLARFVLERKR